MLRKAQSQTWSIKKVTKPTDPAGPASVEEALKKSELLSLKGIRCLSEASSEALDKSSDFQHLKRRRIFFFGFVSFVRTKEMNTQLKAQNSCIIMQKLLSNSPEILSEKNCNYIRKKVTTDPNIIALRSEQNFEVTPSPQKETTMTLFCK